MEQTVPKKCFHSLLSFCKKYEQWRKIFHWTARDLLSTLTSQNSKRDRCNWQKYWGAVSLTWPVIFFLLKYICCLKKKKSLLCSWFRDIRLLGQQHGAINKMWQGSTWQILNISLISNLQYVTFPHVQMSKNYFIFVLYYVELCYYTISNVSSKIQAQKSVILFKIMVHFILSSAANLQGNNSQRRRKEVSKCE